MNPFTGASSSFSWSGREPLANREYTHRALRVQGILALRDCCEARREADGGFYCVPGSHKVIRSWAHAHGEAVSDKQVNAPESGTQIYVPKGDPLRSHAQKAPIRAGDLLIWDARLAHCNYPNESSAMRMVQYIQMTRADDPAFGLLFTDRNMLPPAAQFEPTLLGERLLGFAPWPDGAAASAARV
jgi:ectoine hydroxylase-related dioxygenase (phytanoyl-CoA dioxygenase family)